MDSKDIKVFNAEDFSSVFGGHLSALVEAKIMEADIKYTSITKEERDDCIRLAIKILLDPGVDKSGEHRLGKWESGWSENLDAFKNGDADNLIPKYFYRDNKLAAIGSCGRLNKEYIKPLEPGFDYKILTIIMDWLFEKYAADADAVYEFGCGTGHLLLRLRELNKKAKLYGLDWAEASQKIIEEMTTNGTAQNIYGRKFDFFNPDETFVLDKNSAVYTVGALEQVGPDHEKFIAYLLKNKPKICFHLEPIGEMLDESNLLDFIAKEYFKKRNYLSNFISHLEHLEKDGKIKILKKQRTYFYGNLMAEHSLVVWAPVD